MAPVEALDPQPDEVILDLCGAPGGKTTQILSRMHNQGVMITNDPNRRRVEALTRNTDRWGSIISAVISETPKRLAAHFGPVFDRVLIDAPCSGEGTFRSEPNGIKNWSINFSRRMAAIQDKILWFGSKLVRPGGILVYATCTFNQLENEGSVDRFLKANQNFSIDPISLQTGFSPGIPLDKGDQRNLQGTVRIWPHLAPGEGHYFARLRKSTSGVPKPLSQNRTYPPLSDRQREVYHSFFSSTLQETPLTKTILPGNPFLACYGNQLYSIPEGSLPLSGLHVLRWGWWLGTFKSDRFIPSSALAHGLTHKDSQIVLEFSVSDPDLLTYLKGSSIPASGGAAAARQWVLITVEGFPLGWGQLKQDMIISHLPNWLRYR
jgi:NOL1/NOP2/fmu family ribosome biogenesis protein